MKSQNKTIIQHLKTYGSISPLEAQSNYSIWRLAAVIYRLKGSGHIISTTMKVAPNRAKYAEYRLTRS
jgi:hypothetical protein